MIVAIVAVLSLAALPAAEGQAVTEQPAAWLVETLGVWAEQDATAAWERLEADQPPLVAAQRYGELAQHLYNVRKDVAGMILASRAGIQFALAQAKAAAAADDQTAAKLRGQAKAIAYNLGANCWPGWKDEGIIITATERAIGLDAARLNLRLAIELQRPAEPLGHAQWLLGAQLLAASQHKAASAEFRKGAEHFAAAGKPTEQQMCRTYEALTGRLEQPADAARQAALGKSLEALTALATEDAKFFAQQIRTAEKVFRE